jgi:uncharacterized membrane protein (UPF0127 family)
MTLSLVFGLMVVGCKNGERKSSSGGATGSGGPTVLVRTGDREIAFRVEVARTPAERERGLMYRESMATDAGMLFIFDEQMPLTFWMKNTFIPLDMIFIDSQRKIVGIVENAAPSSLTPRHPGQPAQYVLEINGGLSARLGVRPGMLVEFRNVPGP